MNRRGFIGALLGFAVLPGAKTYRRLWKATEAGVLVPDSLAIAGPVDKIFRAYLEIGEGELFFAESKPGQNVIRESDWKPLGKIWSGGLRSDNVQDEEKPAEIGQHQETANNSAWRH